MGKTVKFEVSKKDNFKGQDLAGRYCASCMLINSGEVTNKITFECNRFKTKQCKHDIELAIDLGLEITNLEIF